MAVRATLQLVEDQINTLNRLVGKEPGEIDSYRLDGAYNGYRLHRIINEHGGITAVTYGYDSLTRVYEFTSGMIQGFLVGREMGRTEVRA